MEEKSLTRSSTRPPEPATYPAGKYDGTGGSAPISVRYFSAHSAAQPRATAHGR